MLLVKRKRNNTGVELGVTCPGLEVLEPGLELRGGGSLGRGDPHAQRPPGEGLRALLLLVGVTPAGGHGRPSSSTVLSPRLSSFANHVCKLGE